VTATEAGKMRAMVLDAPGRPLRAAEIARPRPGPGQVLLEVSACAVCRTDLHVVDAELPHPKLPLVPGSGLADHNEIALLFQQRTQPGTEDDVIVHQEDADAIPQFVGRTEGDHGGV